MQFAFEMKLSEHNLLLNHRVEQHPLREIFVFQHSGMKEVLSGRIEGTI